MVTSTNLNSAFRYWRQRGNSAADAIIKARADVAANRRRYPSHGIIYNRPVPEKRAHGWRGCRWIENASKGLRLVGYADELAPHIRHNGWFADAFEQEVYRGIVYQLPARGRRALYVYGYADPCNEDCAFICFDIERGDILESSWDDDGDAKRESARHADSIAESFADDAREYSQAWNDARLWDDLGAEMAGYRAKARALVHDMRAAIKAGHTASDAICGALREKVRDYLNQWEGARDERAEIESNFSYWEGGRSIDVRAFADSNL